MPLRTWNGSAFNIAKSARVWNGSSWVSAKSAKVWNGSSWVNFLSSVNIENAFESLSSANFDAASSQVSYRLNSDGTALTIQNGDGFYSENPLTGQWFVGGLVSDFSVRATNISQSGTGQVFGTFNTWQSLSTTREWSILVNAAGNDDYQQGAVEILIEIAYTVDTTTVIDSAFVNLVASATVV